MDRDGEVPERKRMTARAITNGSVKAISLEEIVTA
jgi:hypothetical protein